MTMPSCPVFCPKTHRHRVSADRPLACPAPDWMQIPRLARAIRIITRTVDPVDRPASVETAWELAGAYAALGDWTIDPELGE